jgi:hypothetical protein
MTFFYVGLVIASLICKKYSDDRKNINAEGAPKKLLIDTHL